MNIIICRASAYHVPEPDLREYGAAFSCITELTKSDFLEKALSRGQFFDSETRRLLESYDEVKKAIVWNYHGVIYAYEGTVNEFLVEFSSIDMRGNVKRCPFCKECFVSPPTEWYAHILRHVSRQKELFSRQSSAYDFGP